MKITICGGTYEASYIVGMFKGFRGNQIIVINNDKALAKQIASKHKVQVLVSDFTKAYSLDEADVVGSDLFIALSNNDEANYVACTLAKNLYDCKKVISAVSNPNNVAVFKKLGIDYAISSSYLIGQAVKNEANLQNVFKSLSFEDDLITFVEVEVKENYEIANKALKDIPFPEYGTISAINRAPKVIIPKGKTLIQVGDKLIVVVTDNRDKDMIKFLTKTK